MSNVGNAMTIDPMGSAKNEVRLVGGVSNVWLLTAFIPFAYKKACSLDFFVEALVGIDCK